MKEAITNLSKEENVMLQKLLRQFNADESTFARTQRYYRELRRLATLHEDYTYNLQDMMKCALLISQKSQVLWNLRGERIRGIALSLNQVVKSCHRLDHISGTLTMFLRHSKLPDKDLAADLAATLAEIDFGRNFSVKFERAMHYFDFEDCFDQSYGYRRIFTSLAWLLFLDSRHCIPSAQQLQGDALQTDYLLISVFYLMIRHSFEYFRPKQLAHFAEAVHSAKNVITRILEKLFEVFKIDDVRSYKKIANEFDDYFEELVSHGIVRCSSSASMDFLCPELLNINYKKVDLRYQKSVALGAADLRLFLSNRAMTLTPSRHTNNKSANSRPRTLDEPKSNFASHKVLNYDMQVLSYDIQEQERKSSNLCEVIPRKDCQKLPSNVHVSPSLMKAPLICATTLTTGMELQNYINKRIKQTRRKPQASQYYSEIIGLIDSVLGVQAKLKQADTIYSFYVVLCDHFFEEVCVEETESVHLSLLAYSIEVVTYASQLTLMNSPIHFSEKDLKFEEIFTVLQPDPLDLWLVGATLQNTDAQMPQKLRNYLKDLETLLLKEHIWTSLPLIERIQRLVLQEEEDKDELLQLVAAVLDSVEALIQRITREFVCELGEQQEKIHEQAYNCVKYVLASEGVLLWNRHLDQLVICSLYIAIKANQIPLRFNDLVASYEKTATQSRILTRKIVSCVWVHAVDEPHRSSTIIEFYNKVFVPALRPFIPSMKNPPFQSLHPAFHGKDASPSEPSRLGHSYGNSNRARQTPEDHEARKFSYYSMTAAQRSAREKQQNENVKPLVDNNTMRNDTTVRARPVPSQLLEKTEKNKATHK